MFNRKWCCSKYSSIIEELENIKEKGIDLENRFFISDRRIYYWMFIKKSNGLKVELGKDKIGTTKRGIGML